ncbi:MAG TPA: hypothetical protein VKV16_05535 [Solirubrobacteraceae bacterium]|nr:hypothetical protein [Solirubrobacteraceae bacterium]
MTLQRLRLIDGVKEVTLQSSAGGGGGSAGGGSGSGCAAGDPVFSVEIVFDPLPETSAVAAATRSVSDGSSTTPSAGAASKGSTR